MSTIKYFKSKSIARKQIEEEERSRFSWMDQGCLFLKSPRDLHRVKNLVREIKDLIPTCSSVNFDGSLIKLLFVQPDQKNEVMVAKMVWPHNGEPLEFLDPVNFNLDTKLMREIVKKELIVNNFFRINERSLAGLGEELWHIFPLLHHYEYNTRRNCITLKFKESNDAIEAFMMSKNIQIGGLWLTTTFNR